MSEWEKSEKVKRREAAKVGEGQNGANKTRREEREKKGKEGLKTNGHKVHSRKAGSFSGDTYFVQLLKAAKLDKQKIAPLIYFKTICMY